MAYPKVDPSGVSRVFAAAIELTELSHSVTVAQLPAGAVLTVLDRNRTILFRYPNGADWTGQRSPGGGAIERIRSGAPEDVREDASADGRRRLWITVPVQTTVDSGMVLAIGIPNEVAFAESNDQLRQSVWLLVIVLGGTLVVGWIAGGRFVVTPLQFLTEATRRLAGGDITARAELVGSAPGVRELATSINEMAAALQDRQRDQERLRLLGHAIESTNDIVSVIDLDDRFTFVNRAFLRSYGYTADEILGQTSAILRSPDTPNGVIEAISRETRAGGWQGELLTRRKDGTDIFIGLDTSLIRADNGQTIGLLGIARDVSERLQAERALRDVEARMRFALATSHVGIWEGNFKTGQFYWSDIHEAMHGLTPGTFDGTLKAFFACIHPDDREGVRRTLDFSSFLPTS